MGGSLDPVGYDTTELRELARVRGDRYLAHGFLWTTPPDSLPPSDEAAAFDRPVAWSGSLDERQKPYLTRLPESERGVRLAREWVADLVGGTGADAAVEAFSYYESIGWITEPVREELEGYLLAVDYRDGGSLEDLTRSDHVESLRRTARLAQLADDGAARSDGTDASPEDGDTDGSDTDDGTSERPGRLPMEPSREDVDETEDEATNGGVAESGFEFDVVSK